MLAVVWTLAVAGVVFKLLAGARYRKVSVALYVAMGWAALAVIQPLWTHMAPGGLAWLFAGGIAYTAGVVFYLLHERMRYSHLVWHLFVLGGTVCHFVMVFRYAIRSEEHTSELQSLMRISYAVFCLKKKTNKKIHITN